MPAKRSYWLIKSEPSVYPWAQLVREGNARWDGVRNFEARNNLRAMRVGDLLLFYHSNEGKEIVGIARVAREAYQDPTTKDDWSCVDVEPVAPFTASVTLDALRKAKSLSELALLRRSRLSVTPVTKPEFDAILKLGKTAPPG